MTRRRLTCWLVGLIAGGGAFAWLNTANALHDRATFIVEYELEAPAGRDTPRPVAAELRFGAGRDESAHGVAPVRLDLPGVLPLRPAREHRVQVERVGRKSDVARDAQVWINRALADGGVALPHVSERARHYDATIELLEPGARAEYRGKFEEFALDLLTHDWSGVVRIQVDESPPLEIDLYSAARGGHVVRFVETDATIAPRAAAAWTPHRPVFRLSLRALDAQDQFRVTGLLVRSGHKLRRIPIAESSPGDQWRHLSNRGLSAKRHRALTGVHVTMALALGWAAAAIAGHFARPRTEPPQSPTRVSRMFAGFVVALLLAQAAFWLAGAWPAILTTDSLHVWQQTQDLWIDTWLSHTYVLFVLMTRQLWDSPAALSIVQSVLTALLAGGLFIGLHRRGLRAGAVLPFALLFVTAVPIGAYAMYHTRDTLFGLTGVAIAAVIFFWGWEARYQPPWSPRRPALLALALLAGCHATVRAEGVLVLALAALALWLVVRLPLWRVGAFVLISGGLWFALNGPLIRALNVQSSPLYGLTTRLDPLGAIISGPYNTDDPARDRAIIEKVVPFDRLKERHKNIVVYWDGSIDKSNLSLDDLNALNQLYFTLVRRNLSKFLANRWDNFSRLCCSDDQFNLGGLLNDAFGVEMTTHIRDLGLNEHATVPIPAARDFVRRLIANSIRVGQRPIDWRSITWNLWPPVILTVAAVLAFRRIPVTAMAAALVGYRIAVIFAAAPASMFKYLYDVYFLGFFLVPMALLELGSRDPRLARLFLRRTAP